MAHGHIHPHPRRENPDPDGNPRGTGRASPASRHGSNVYGNVSAKGARVVSVRRWDKNARLVFASRTGEFRSAARVAYCQPIHGEGYAMVWSSSNRTGDG